MASGEGPAAVTLTAKTMPPAAASPAAAPAVAVRGCSRGGRQWAPGQARARSGATAALIPVPALIPVAAPALIPVTGLAPAAAPAFAAPAFAAPAFAARSGPPHRRQRSRRAGQRGGREDGAEAAVELGQLTGQGVTARAVLEMLVDDAAPAPAQLATGVRAEHGRVRLAGGRNVASNVLLQVSLPETFPGPYGQSRHSVGRQPEHRRDRGGCLALDLQLPENGTPARRQAAERRSDQASLGPGFGLCFRAAGQLGQAHVLFWHTVFEILVEIADDGRPAAGAQPVVGRVADRRQQVRAEGQAGAAAGPDRPEHAGKGLGDDVVGRVALDHRERDAPRNRRMLDVQLLVRATGNVADRQDCHVVGPAVLRQMAAVGDLFPSCPAEHDNLRAISGAGPIMPSVEPKH